MKALVVVQARMGSSRLPNKVMLPLAGAPLLERCVERVMAATTPFEVVIATTVDPADDVLVSLARRIGVRCFRGHPDDLLDRHYRAALSVGGADTVVKIPSDCPLIDPAVVDRVLAHHASAAGVDYTSNLHPATYPDGQDVEAMPLGVLEVAHREAVRPFEREHTTPFIWERPERFRLQNVTWESGLNYAMSHRLTIDYREDYELISAVYEALWSASRPVFGLGETLRFLEAHPDVFARNQAYAGVNWYRHHLAELRTVGKDDTRSPSTNSTTTIRTPPGGFPVTHAEQEALALRVREHIIRMSTDGGCFIGASLSCADLIVHLYTRVLRVSPKTVADPNRDYFFLSKGHDVPALYGTLAELGFIEPKRLANHLKTDDSIYWHPNRAVPGIEFHSGSLGHLLSVAIGVALDIKLRGGNSRVFVVLGDGELDEGTIWEGCLVAQAHRLDNLVVVVDRNEFQANIRTEELIPLEPVDAKFRAFGWTAQTIDGHSFSAMDAAFSQLPVETGKPTAIVARTVRGKGLPSIERRADRWFVNFTHEEVEMLLRELRGQNSANLTSETLMVR